MQSAVSSVEPIDQLGIATTFFDETIHRITAVAPALFASNAQHIELADEIAEYDCAVAGHGDHHRTASAILNACLQPATHLHHQLGKLWSWLHSPKSYHVTYLPGFDKFVITASRVPDACLAELESARKVAEKPRMAQRWRRRPSAKQKYSA